MLENPKRYVKHKYIAEGHFSYNSDGYLFGVSNHAFSVSLSGICIFKIADQVSLSFVDNVVVFDNTEVVNVSDAQFAQWNTKISFLLPKIQQQVLKHTL